MLLSLSMCLYISWLLVMYVSFTDKNGWSHGSEDIFRRRLLWGTEDSFIGSSLVLLVMLNLGWLRGYLVEHWKMVLRFQWLVYAILCALLSVVSTGICSSWILNRVTEIGSLITFIIFPLSFVHLLIVTRDVCVEWKTSPYWITNSYPKLM